MPVNLLRFTPYIIGKISNFLENESILELRQVCKATDESLSTVAVTQPTDVQLQISKDLDDGKSQMFLFFQRKVIFWKLCLMSILRRLSIDPTTALSQEHLMALCISLGWSDLKRFLAAAKDIFTSENIDIGLNKSDITNDDMELEVIQMYAEFLQGKTLQSITVIYPLSDHAQMKMWTTFFKKVNSKTAYFQFEKLDKGSAELLLELSNSIASITVTFTDHSNTKADNIQSIIVEMMRRKCVNIFIYGSPPFTLENIEKLIQFANQCDKKISISANATIANFRYQVGAYEAVNTDGEFSLTHL